MRVPVYARDEESESEHSVIDHCATTVGVRGAGNACNGEQRGLAVDPCGPRGVDSVQPAGFTRSLASRSAERVPEPSAAVNNLVYYLAATS